MRKNSLKQKTKYYFIEIKKLNKNTKQFLLIIKNLFLPDTTLKEDILQHLKKRILLKTSR